MFADTMQRVRVDSVLQRTILNIKNLYEHPMQNNNKYFPFDR
jgi:hypothetical protein